MQRLLLLYLWIQVLRRPGKLHTRNISFKVVRKAILTAEIAENPFSLLGSALDPAEGAYNAPKTP